VDATYLKPPAVKQEQMAQVVSSSDSLQQLAPITRDLAAVRSSLEQLAVKQEQMAKNIAALQAASAQTAACRPITLALALTVH
jgi:hypothetical protein